MLDPELLALLVCPETHQDLIEAGPDVGLIGAALDAGVRVYLYCIDEGVKAVATPEIQALKTRGVHLFGCAYGAGNRKIALDDAAAWSGLTVLADVVGSTDRFLSF